MILSDIEKYLSDVARKPGGSCSYVSHHYKSQCSQVYNYHRLLSWDKERGEVIIFISPLMFPAPNIACLRPGLHMDIYKVPTCCSCHIMGYSYVYPPLKKPDQSPAIHHPPATTHRHSPIHSHHTVPMVGCQRCWVRTKCWRVSGSNGHH